MPYYTFEVLINQKTKAMDKATMINEILLKCKSSQRESIWFNLIFQEEATLAKICNELNIKIN